jgi:multiple sugar transport system substrate-binding protein
MVLPFLASPEIMGEMNAQMGMISPNKLSLPGNDPFIKSGAMILNNAKGIAHFFDRDINPEIKQYALIMLREFILNPEDYVQILDNFEKNMDTMGFVVK